MCALQNDIQIKGISNFFTSVILTISGIIFALPSKMQLRNASWPGEDLPAFILQQIVNRIGYGVGTFLGAYFAGDRGTTVSYIGYKKHIFTKHRPVQKQKSPLRYLRALKN